MSTRIVKVNQQTETDVAVLQVKVENIEQDVTEIKGDIKFLTDALGEKTESTHKMLKEISEAAAEAHKSLDAKISSLEKWRWMMMGAGIVLGSLGYGTIEKLLK